MIARLNSETCPDTFVYVFRHLPPNWRDKCVAFQGLELPYVFGYIPEGLFEDIVQYLAPGGGGSPGDPGYDEFDDFVAEYCTSMWSHFAKTRNPSAPGLINWPVYTAVNDTYLEIGSVPTVKTGVAAAYTQPSTPGVNYITTTNATYGFSVTHPHNWTQGAAPAPGVVWRVGRPNNYMPSLRVIVRPSSQGATLQDVFTTHLTADGGKSISSYAEETHVEINGHVYTKAAVTCTTSAYTYNSKIIGRIVGENWMVFEVYSVTTLAFDSPTQQDYILNSVTFP